MSRIVLAVVVVAVGTLAVLTTRAPADTGPALIRISSVETRLVKIDVGTRGRSAGDMEVIRQSLYNARITPKAIGNAQLVCTYTFGSARECRGTYILPKGKLVVGGRLFFRDIYELAIIGGTGLYNNARGTLTATRTRRTPRREFLIFRLAG